MADNVSEGEWQNKEVAFKEISRKSAAAKSEVDGYIKMAGEKNILRMLYHFLEPTTVRLVLEKSHCSLTELMESYSWEQNTSASTSTTPKAAFLNELGNIWAADGKLGKKHKLSSVLLGIIRDILYGLELLKKIKHKHEHLTQDSVMIFNNYEAKLSMAQHQKQSGPDNVDVDYFLVAKIVHFCGTFGESVRVRSDNISVSSDLPNDVSNLIKYLSKGPKAKYLDMLFSNHIAFWKLVKRMNFYCEASFRLRSADGSEISFLEYGKATLHGGHESWKSKIDQIGPKLSDAVTSGRENLRETWTKHLVKFIRIVYVHMNDPNIKDIIGDTPIEFDEFFNSLFPNLLVRVYDLALNHWMKEEVFYGFIGRDL